MFFSFYLTVITHPSSVNRVFLVANNPNMGHAAMRRNPRDLIVRFNTCIPPTEDLFHGHTDALYLRAKGHEQYHGLSDEGCHLSCKKLPPNATIFKVGEWDERCNSQFAQRVERMPSVSCDTLGIVPCPKWGLHTGSMMAVYYRTRYPRARVILLGFTFHQERFKTPEYGHDGAQEERLLRAWNVSIVKRLDDL